jgi:hypothetical protein
VSNNLESHLEGKSAKWISSHVAIGSTMQIQAAGSPIPKANDLARPNPSAWATWLEGNESYVILAFALLLFLVNLGTSSLYPTSWMDEAMFSDPAINYLEGRGFTSTAWWQSKEVVWSGNVPLYTVAMVPWIKVWGVGLVTNRTFNYIVISLTLVLFWLAVKRLALVQSALFRIGMTIVIFLSFPLCFPYRSARPDCLGMLICTTALLAWSWKNKTARHICLFLAGCFIPLSGLQLVPFVGLLFLLVFAFEGKQAIPPLMMLGLGIAAGGIALFSYYYVNHLTGVIETAKEARRLHHLAELATFHGEPTLRDKIVIKLRRIFGNQAGDYGIGPTLAALLVLICDPRIWRDRKTVKLALAAIAASFAIVSALEIFLHYLQYYHWMNYIIAALIVFIILGQSWKALKLHTKYLVSLLLLASVMGGLPLRLFLGAAFGQGHEYVMAQALIREQVKPTDIVFSDFMGYIPLKETGCQVYLPPYMRVIREEEKRSVNVLVLDPINFDGYSKPFTTDGNWKQVAVLSSQPTALGRLVQRFFRNYTKQPTSCGYAMIIVRREPPPADKVL